MLAAIPVVGQRPALAALPLRVCRGEKPHELPQAMNIVAGTAAVPSPAPILACAGRHGARDAGLTRRSQQERTGVLAGVDNTKVQIFGYVLRQKLEAVGCGYSSSSFTRVPRIDAVLFCLFVPLETGVASVN